MGPSITPAPNVFRIQFDGDWHDHAVTRVFIIADQEYSDTSYEVD